MRHVIISKSKAQPHAAPPHIPSTTIEGMTMTFDCVVRPCTQGDLSAPSREGGRSPALYSKGPQPRARFRVRPGASTPATRHPVAIFLPNRKMRIIQSNLERLLEQCPPHGSSRIRTRASRSVSTFEGPRVHPSTSKVSPHRPINCAVYEPACFVIVCLETHHRTLLHVIPHGHLSACAPSHGVMSNCCAERLQAGNRQQAGMGPREVEE